MTSLKPRSTRPENRVEVDLYAEDGEFVHIDIPKANFQTFKRKEAIRKWVSNQDDSAGSEDLMLYVLELLGQKDALKFIKTHEVEVQQINELLRLYSGGAPEDEDDEGDVSQGKSSES